MFNFVGNIVSGGWDAVTNVADTIGKGASYAVSGFFPSTQKTEPIKSEITKAAGGSGMTSRPTIPENQSMNETRLMYNKGYYGSPYEDQFAIGVKTAESQAVAKTMSGDEPSKTWGENLVDILKGTQQVVGKAAETWGGIKTIAQDFMGDIGLIKREKITETPREGFPAGQDVQHLNDIRQTGANVLEMIKGVGSAFVNQVKGLFNLGYPQDTAQPGFSIKHEVEPSKKTTIGLAVAAAVIILIILLGRKR